MVIPKLKIRVDITEEEKQKNGILFAKFVEYAPDLKRPMTPEESVRAVLSVVEKASIQGGYGGQFISHLGTKRWL